MYYRMNVAGLERDLPICPVNDKLYIAGFVIFGDQELTVACARELLARAPEYGATFLGWTRITALPSRCSRAFSA